MHHRGLTLIEVVIVVIVLAVVSTLVVTSLKRSRQRARIAQNSTQLRGIHQAFVLFSQGNKSYYPGLTGEGKMIADMPVSGQGSGTPYPIFHAPNGHMSSLAMATILNGGWLTPAYYLSPAEVNPHFEQAGDFASNGHLVTPINYSYSLSRAADPEVDSGRIVEWRDNTNSKSIVLSDRVLTSGFEVPFPRVVQPNVRRSIWTTTDGQWHGGVVHGDNSTEHLTTWTVPTRYQNGTAIGAPFTTNAADDIFVPAGAADAYQIRQ